MIDPSEHAGFVFNILQHVNSDRRLTPAASRVAFWLTHHLGRETHMCWPSINRLVRLTGFSKQTIVDAIDNLEASGYIGVMRQHMQNNVYTVRELNKWVMPVESRSQTQGEMSRGFVESKNQTQGGLKTRPKMVQKVDPNHLNFTTKDEPWVADATARMFSAEEFTEEGDAHPDYEIVQREDGTLAIASYCGPSQSEAELVAAIQDTARRLRKDKLDEDTAAAILKTLRYRLALSA